MKRMLLFVSLFLLAACTPTAPAEPVQASVLQPRIISTARIVTPVPTVSPLPSPTSTSTPVPDFNSFQPTEAADPCLKLSTPIDGAVFNRQGRIALVWERQLQAKYYIVLLRHPDGTEERIQSLRASLDLHLKPAQDAAPYQWHVLAYDSSDRLLCDSPIYRFSLIKATDTPITP